MPPLFCCSALRRILLRRSDTVTIFLSFPRSLCGGLQWWSRPRQREFAKKLAFAASCNSQSNSATARQSRFLFPLSYSWQHISPKPGPRWEWFPSYLAQEYCLAAWSAGSLIPGIIGHFVMDVGLFAYWWTGIAGDFTARPITETGVDRPFFIACFVFATSLVVALLAMWRLHEAVPTDDLTRSA